MRWFPALVLSAALALTGCSTPPAPSDPVAAITSGGYQVIDVRTPEEFATGHLKGAKNVDLYQNFPGRIASLNKEGRYVVYCHSGSRSAHAKRIMEGEGFVDVVDAGGFDQLKAAGVPVE